MLLVQQDGTATCRSCSTCPSVANVGESVVRAYQPYKVGLARSTLLGAVETRWIVRNHAGARGVLSDLLDWNRAIIDPIASSKVQTSN